MAFVDHIRSGIAAGHLHWCRDALQTHWAPLLGQPVHSNTPPHAHSRTPTTERPGITTAPTHLLPGRAQQSRAPPHIPDAVQAADFLALRVRVAPNTARTLLSAPFQWDAADTCAAWGNCRLGPAPSLPEGQGIHVSAPHARALPSRLWAVHSGCGYDSATILPLCVSWAGAHLADPHTHLDAPRTVAAHYSQEHGITLDPAGPVILARECPAGHMVLLPADLCTTQEPLQLEQQPVAGPPHEAEGPTAASGSSGAHAGPGTSPTASPPDSAAGPATPAGTAAVDGEGDTAMRPRVGADAGAPDGTRGRSDAPPPAPSGGIASAAAPADADGDSAMVPEAPPPRAASGGADLPPAAAPANSQETGTAAPPGGIPPARQREPPRCTRCNGWLTDSARHLCPGHRVTGAGPHSSPEGACEVCGARFPKVPSARSAKVMREFHTGRCRAAFPDAWQCPSRRSAAPACDTPPPASPPAGTQESAAASAGDVASAGDSVMTPLAPHPPVAGTAPFAAPRLAPLMQSVQAGALPTIADVTDALANATVHMQAEGPVVQARPARGKPLHTFGPLDGDPRTLVTALSKLPEVDAARWLFLGGYCSAAQHGLHTLTLLAALKCLAPSSVRLLRGHTERVESPHIQGLLQSLRPHYGDAACATLSSLLGSFFDAMPWVAKLRGSTVATPSAITCVEGADVLLTDVGNGAADSRASQWAALALGSIAPADARSSRSASGAWTISRAELSRGLRRWNKHLLVRAGPRSEAGVIPVDATRQ
eukprot:gene16407-biopygen7159